MATIRMTWTVGILLALSHVVVVLQAKDDDDRIAANIAIFTNEWSQKQQGCNGNDAAWSYRGICYALYLKEVSWQEARSGGCPEKIPDLVDSTKLIPRKFLNALHYFNNNITTWVGFKEENVNQHYVRGVIEGKILNKKGQTAGGPLECMVSKLDLLDETDVLERRPCTERHAFICRAHDLERDRVTAKRTQVRTQEKHRRKEDIAKNDLCGSIEHFNRKENATGLIRGDTKEKPQEHKAVEVKSRTDDEHPSRKKRNAVIRDDYLWTDHTVYFTFTPDYENELRERVLTQIGHIEDKTCLRFLEVDEQQAENVQAYIVIGDFGGCWSYVGMYSGPQEVSLPEFCTEKGGRIQHEFLHALGFYHEHSRQNRDDYIKIVEEEISEGLLPQISKRRSNDQAVGYDHASVMHYASNAVSKSVDIDSLVAIRPRDADMGQRQEMTPSDYAKVNLLYECQGVAIHGEWSLWGDWSSCSALCGTGQRSRERLCSNPPPMYGGRDCEGPPAESDECNTQPCNQVVMCAASVALGCWLDGDDADSLTSLEGSHSLLLDDYDVRLFPITACEAVALERGHEVFAVKDSGKCLVQLATDHPLLYQYEGPSDDCVAGEGFDEGISVYRLYPGAPVDGQWTAWTVPTLCTATCGGGTHTRTRSCTNPAPSNGGKDCQGSPTETSTCNDNPCPVHGGWSSWTEWSECNSECISRRSRSCSNPKPAYEGDQCQGHTSEYYFCCDPNKVDGEWTDWVGPTTCTKTCGGGTQSYVRTCTNPAPSNGGADCQGNSTAVEACNTEPCVVNGGWSGYTEFSECTVSCGGGTKYRTRTCNNPPPSPEGDDCIGSGVETVPCNDEPCPVDGGWGEWSAYSECTVTCGTGTRTRSRLCDDPEPAYNGAPCEGPATEEDTCSPGECPVDGGWTEWVSGDCSVTCGLGSYTETRTCTEPPPAYGGRACEGDPSQVVPCQKEECPLPGVPELPAHGFFLPFDEQSGGVVSSSSLSLSVEGGAGIVSTGGRVDGFLRLEERGGLQASLADNDLGRCLSSPDLCPDGFSLSLFFRQTPRQRSESEHFRPSTLFSTGVESEEATTPADGLGLALFIRRNGDLKATVATQDREYTVDLPAFLFENTNTWHPLALTFHKDEGLKFFYKGVAENWDEHGRVNTGGKNVTNILQFGRPSQCYDHYVHGDLDHFKAWNTKLSPEQVYADYMSVPARCTDCDSRAVCNVTAMTCTCFDGYEGAGRTCKMVGRGGSGVAVPDPPHCWPFNKVVRNEGIFDADTPVFRDGDMLLTAGVVDHAVSLNGRRVWLNAGDFSDQCLSSPDVCSSGFAVSFWIKYYGSEQVNFIFSTGSQNTAENTGVACWVEDDNQMTCRVQTLATRYQLTATIRRGVWSMLTTAWSAVDGLQLYVDGQPLTGDPSGQPHAVSKESPTQLTIGRPNDVFGNNGRFDIDNLAVWQELLTPLQIDSVYHNGLLCQSNSRR